MTAPIPVHPNVNYILADGPEEIRRLSGQYFFQRALFGHEHESAFLPESIDLSKVKRVLDAAAGTAVWVLDLSDKPFASSLELYACDLTTAKFPPEDVLDRARVKAFQQDLTKPFPEDMIASFDLVHIAMIYYAVTEEEWRLVLENVRNILRPGGYLLLQEGDPVAYNLDNPPPPDGVPHDIQKSINGAQPLHALNSIFTGFALKKGFVVGLSYRFQDLLTAQTFSVLSRVRTLACVGSLMQSHQGLAGAELGQYWDQVTPNMSMVVDTLSKVLLRDGDLEAPKGAQIQSEEARKTMITQVQAAIHDGLLVVMSEWVAQK